MNLTPTNPWRALDSLHDELNRVFERSVQGYDADRSNVVTSQWIPAVDIKEDPDKYMVYADLPGMDPNDIEITMENGVLSIRGERRFEDAHEGDGYSRVERRRGVFYRRFSLPDGTDPEGVTARENRGVLEITIPKAEKAQPKRIQVEH